jgi:hypothetical protein
MAKRFGDERGSAKLQSSKFADIMKSLGRGPGKPFLSRAERGISPEFLFTKGVSNMPFAKGSTEEFDALSDMGRSLVGRDLLHGIAVESEFDVCAFDRWRRKAADLLFSHGGCDDLYYQRFSKEVVDPNIRSLEQGLRILAAARDDVERLRASSKRASGRASVSYH